MSTIILCNRSFYYIIICIITTITIIYSFHGHTHNSEVFHQYINENKQLSDSLNITKTRSFLEVWCNLNNKYYESPYGRTNNTMKEDINIIFIGGADIEGYKYQGICNTLSDTIYQLSNGTQLTNIVVCPINGIFKLLLLFKWPELLIRAALRLFSNMNNNTMIKASNVWIIGHSLGAYVTNDIASRFMRGFISIGSVKNMDLSSHMKPMLHVALENDGLMSISVYADIMKQSLKHPLGYRCVFDDQWSEVSSTIIGNNVNSSNYVASKNLKRLFQRGPIISNGVIIVKGVNHMQVATNQITRAAIRTHREDLKPDDDVTLSVAHHRIASPIASFILSHHSGTFIDNYLQCKDSSSNEINSGSSSLSSSSSSFSSDMQATLDLLFPFIKAQDPSTDHDTIKRWQRYVLDIAMNANNSFSDDDQAVYSKAKRQISRQQLHATDASSPSDFMYSKASASLSWLPSQINRLQFTSDAFYYKTNAVECLMKYRGIIPFSTAPTTMHVGHMLMVKMKSPAYIRHMIRNKLVQNRPSSRRFDNSSLLLANARVFNEQTFNIALDMVPSIVKEKYQRSGRRLEFLPDKMVSSGSEWLTTPSMVTNKDDSLVRDSSIIDTSIHNCSQFQSYAVATPVPPSLDMHISLSKEIEHFLGVQYVKLISLSFALEWIYYWSRR